MRKVRSFTVAAAAIAGLGLAATPALAENVYTIDGSGTTGGTPSKPKPAKLTASFTIRSGNDLIPDVVKEYRISIEGGRLNKAALNKLAKCKANGLTDAVQTNTQCPSKSVVGSGQLTAAVGKPGNPIVRPNLVCTLPFNLYNTGGGNLGLFINATSDQCPIPVKQWIVVKVTQKGRTVTTAFVTPENLQQPLEGTFSPVTDTTFSLKPIMVKVGKKKQSVTESIGCTDGKRDVSVVFVERSGRTVTAKKTLKC